MVFKSNSISPENIFMFSNFTIEIDFSMYFYKLLNLFIPIRNWNNKTLFIRIINITKTFKVI